MGCDIHICVELQEYGGMWEPAILEHGAYDTRNYAVFSKLAGVRGDLLPIAEPRGLPKDVSREVANQFENGMGDHTPSYLTVKEILDAPWSDEEALQCSEFLEWLKFKGTWLEYVIQDTPEKVRLVFNFDS